MAITYLNSNIIKMYYGGNEIKQAYLNGNYFFPVSHTSNWDSGIQATWVKNTAVPVNVGYAPDYSFFYSDADSLSSTNDIMIDFHTRNGFINSTTPNTGLEIWSTSSNYSIYHANKVRTVFTDTGITYTSASSNDATVTLLQSDTTSGKTYSNYATGTVTMTDQYINVTDLSFIPKFIVIYKVSSGEGGARFCHYMVWNVNKIPVYTGVTTETYGLEYGETSDGSFAYTLDTGKYTITNNSFNFRTSSSTVAGDVYRWEVWGD